MPAAHLAADQEAAGQVLGLGAAWESQFGMCKGSAASASDTLAGCFATAVAWLRMNLRSSSSFGAGKDAALSRQKPKDA